MFLIRKALIKIWLITGLLIALALLSIHFGLAMICMKTERTEEARQYLKYCIEHGGETHMQAKAVDLWNELYIVRKT